MKRKMQRTNWMLREIVEEWVKSGVDGVTKVTLVEQEMRLLTKIR